MKSSVVSDRQVFNEGGKTSTKGNYQNLGKQVPNEIKINLELEDPFS